MPPHLTPRACHVRVWEQKDTKPDFFRVGQIVLQDRWFLVERVEFLQQKMTLLHSFFENDNLLFLWLSVKLKCAHQSIQSVFQSPPLTNHTIVIIAPLLLSADPPDHHDYTFLMSTPKPAQRIYRTSVFSRERNRMHARKTRQRKKEHMQKLQNRADELKAEQIRLKQCINEKNTANILVGLFQTGEDSAAADGSDDTETAVSMDPQVEVLLKRPTEEIPDASKIPELPALILPGQHTRRKSASNDGEDNAPASGADGEGVTIPEGEQEDGIDYVLLGKDRGSCTPAELDQIRRERNRMHAKRTRDRKRIFMEEMETMIKQLEDENALLQGHMDKLNENEPDENIAAAELLAATASLTPPPAISPELGPVAAPSNSSAPADPLAAATEQQPSKGDFLNQIESLLAAAGAFERSRSQCEVNAISISCAASDVTDQSSYGCDDDHSSHDNRPSKKQRRHLEEEDRHASVPKSITTTNLSL